MMFSSCHMVLLQEEEEGIGDVDLFTLVDDSSRLAVNAKWLGHLAERQLGEDGHPRKVCCLATACLSMLLPSCLIAAGLHALNFSCAFCLQVGPKEDPYKMGLVLEWVYGTIVSTAEKARDGAKRALGECLC
jgi:hypothetical protein